MRSSQTTEEIVLRYFNAWQEPADYELFRNCFADDVIFNSNFGVITGAQALTDMVRASESPWKEVTLLAASYATDHASIFYDGTDKSSNVQMRVAEYLKLRDERISQVIVVIAQKEG